MPNRVVKPKPPTCDLCGGVMSGKVFYDARIPSAGSWGDIYHACFQAHGCKLGTGRGQKYRRAEDGLFEKVGG